MFNLTQDWIAYIFVAFSIGLGTYFIIMAGRANNEKLQNRGMKKNKGMEKEEKATKKN
ncbi:MAG: hypothetical protein ACMUIM_07655 [bacterium]